MARISSVAGRQYLTFSTTPLAVRLGRSPARCLLGPPNDPPSSSRSGWCSRPHRPHHARTTCPTAERVGWGAIVRASIWWYPRLEIHCLTYVNEVFPHHLREKMGQRAAWQSPHFPPIYNNSLGIADLRHDRIPYTTLRVRRTVPPSYMDSCSSVALASGTSSGSSASSK